MTKHDQWALYNIYLTHEDFEAHNIVWEAVIKTIPKKKKCKKAKWLSEEALQIGRAHV